MNSSNSPINIDPAVPDGISSNPRAIADALRNEISDGTWPAGTVRSIGELTRRFTTSRHYINTAVRLLRNSGTVDTRNGGGGGITPHGTVPPRWDGPSRNDILTTVRRRIGDGTYPVGELLPSLATLGTELGVARSTVFLSLLPLRDEGSLSVTGGRTLVNGLPTEADESDHTADEDRGIDTELKRGPACA
ncbi:GntR family transcriptional regulator [Streptomyces tauricus]|uniref:GntR family transcriptional regulator n=1 Tax=Streptomyces tauricus TaxID=68274 RepID=UPI0022441C01|nr:GntR family transcriptional regulator [Streptomyces tauricus]MCW8101698.1 GntR family transcriptional regulator [Streptomyces tauricus]